MKKRARLRRQDPERSGPIRNWSTMYRPSDSWNLRGTEAESQPRSQERGAPSISEGATRGVEIGYQVIEEYLRTGQRTAERINSQPYISHASSNSVPVLVEKLVAGINDMFPLWLELVTSMARVDPSRLSVAGSPTNHAASNGSTNGRPGSSSIEVKSARKVQVGLELHPDSDHMPLVTLGLRTLNPRKPALTAISFIPARSKRRSELRVRIPDTQPAGIYSGVMVNRVTGETRGTLSIRVGKA